MHKTSQGSAATRLRCGWIILQCFVASVRLFPTVKNFDNRLILDKARDKKVTNSQFFGPLCISEDYD